MARLVVWDGVVHDVRAGVRRERLVLAHGATGLVGGLDHDDEVVLADGAGEHYAARVVDLYLGDEDTTYVLLVGVRLPPEVADERVAEHDTAGGGDAPPGDDDAEEILRLLDALRRRRTPPPDPAGDDPGS